MQGLNVSPESWQSGNSPNLRLNTGSLVEPLEEQKLASFCAESQWDHSGHITDFVKAIVDDRYSRYIEPDVGSSEIMSSLKALVSALEAPKAVQSTRLPEAGESTMPPLDAVVTVLRWAKGQSPVSDETSYVDISQIMETTPRHPGSQSFYLIKGSRRYVRRCTSRLKITPMSNTFLPMVSHTYARHIRNTSTELRTTTHRLLVIHVL